MTGFIYREFRFTLYVFCRDKILVIHESRDMFPSCQAVIKRQQKTVGSVYKRFSALRVPHNTAGWEIPGLSIALNSSGSDWQLRQVKQ